MNASLLAWVVVASSAMGQITNTVVSTLTAPENSGFEACVLQDVDRDGRDDLVIAVAAYAAPRSRSLQVHLRPEGRETFRSTPDRTVRLTPDVTAFALLDLGARYGKDILLFNRSGAWVRVAVEGQRPTARKMLEADLIWQLADDSDVLHWGAGVRDLNGDGLDDLYVPFQAGVPNRMLGRKADGTIVDLSRKSLTNYLENTPSALLVDLDNDGDQDLVFGTDGGIGQARNDGKGVYGSPRLKPPSTVGEIYSLTAADPDLDGDLDVYVSRYGSGGILGAFPTPYHDANNGAANIYLENAGRRFVEKTEEIGLDENNRRFSLAAVWDDLDADSRLDLYVANDFGRNNLFKNEGGRFRDVAAEFLAEDMAAGMGVSAADFDGDGDTDLYITNMFSSAGLRIVPQTGRFMDGANVDVHRHYKRHARGNTLLANRGDGRFEDITDSAGVAVGGWGWGAGWLDLNNDGQLDLYSPNGFLTNRQPDDI